MIKNSVPALFKIVLCLSTELINFNGGQPAARFTAELAENEEFMQYFLVSDAPKGPFISLLFNPFRLSIR